MSAHILSVAEIAALAAQALRDHGASESQAAALAAGVAAAERDGLRSHGLMYLPTYCEHLDLRQGRRAGAAGPIASGAGKPRRRRAFGLRACRHRPWSARAGRRRRSQWRREPRDPQFL